MAALEVERKQLLIEAGMASLLGGGLGLANEKLTRILRGETLTIAMRDLDPVAIEQWRRRRRRLGELDTAIDALRVQLGMPPSADRVVPSAKSGRATAVNEAMDQIGTQPL